MTDTKQFSEILKEWTEVFMRRSFHDFKHFMDEEGLSPTQVNTLMRLHHCGESGVSELGESAGVSNAAASQMIDRLVMMGLMARVESADDRRFKQVSLTDEGNALVKRGVEARRAWLEELTRTLNPTEQETIAQALTTLTRAARLLDGADQQKLRSHRDQDS